MEFEEEIGPETAAFDSATFNVPDILGDDPLSQPMPGQPVATTPEMLPPSQGGLTEEAIFNTLKYGFLLLARNLKDGEFWELSDEESRELAKVWYPVLGPLWLRLLGETNGQLLPAVGMTAASLGPRAFREVSRRVSTKASTETVRSGASSTLQASPEAESPMRQTDL